MIIWLASYPKSGNTWVRAFLSTYIYSQNEEFKFENMKKIDLFPQMKYFNDIGVIPNNLSEFAKNLILTQDKINLSNDIVFFKTHNAMCSIGNYPFTNKDNTLGVIYLIRDPRDVLISYSKHDDTSMDFSLKALINSKNAGYLIDDKNKKLLSTIGNWSENYNSWKNFNLTKKIIIKYEDLLINPFDNFLKIIEYLNKLYGLKIDKDKIKKIIEITKFSNLQDLEKKFGFNEKISKKELFFREGKSGYWKSQLDKKIIDKIENLFCNEMKELNYL